MKEKLIPITAMRAMYKDMYGKEYNPQYFAQNAKKMGAIKMGKGSRGTWFIYKENAIAYIDSHPPCKQGGGKRGKDRKKRKSRRKKCLNIKIM